MSAKLFLPGYSKLAKGPFMPHLLKMMDRFERELAQDGFIQRAIDNYIIRFRVSVLPMVGTELKNKFESIKIGQTADYQREITEVDIQKFAEVSGDHNPVHMRIKEACYL